MPPTLAAQGHAQRAGARSATPAPGQRAARVARIQCCVRLNDIVDDANIRAGPRRQRTTERRDDAGCYRAGEAVRIADRDDELSHAQTLRVAEPGRDEIACIRAQYGEI